MTDVRLSLCMIVRDEEEYLPGCLESVRGLADEIVIVDTGSSDRTPEIAREYRAQVYEFAWTDDFSEARNESLKHATGEWILHLDADERVPEGEGPRIREALRDPEHEAIQVIVRHLSPKGDLVKSLRQRCVRLWRNLPEVRFEGAAHEQILPAIRRKGLRVLETDVVIEHLGYADVGERRDRRQERVLRQLDRAVREHPDDAFYRYNYGVGLHLAGDTDQARAEFERALELADADLSPEVLLQLHTKLGQTYLAQCDLDRARTCVNAAIRMSPEEPLPHYVLAAIHFAKGEFEDARRELESILEVAQRPEPPMVLMELDIGEVYGDIGDCYYRLGLLEEAEAAYRRALAEKPEAAVVHFNLGTCLLKRGSLDDAADAYEQALKLDPTLSRAQQALDLCRRLQYGLQGTE